MIINKIDVLEGFEYNMRLNLKLNHLLIEK